MAAGRTFRSLVGRRRRAGDEGEDDDGPFMVEDSQSEGSVLSDGDDEEADASSHGDEQNRMILNTSEAAKEASANGTKPVKKARKARKKGKTKELVASELATAQAQQQSEFKAMADTEAMMNGLKIGGSTETQEAVDFENMTPNGEIAPAETVPTATITPKSQSRPPGDLQRREHEEYRRKRDTDPAFIPNRGNFFMHDTRGQHNGHPPPPARGTWQGRGRGREGFAGNDAVGGPFSPANHFAQAERAAEQPWKHDLHDTINEELGAMNAGRTNSHQQHDREASARLFPRQSVTVDQARPRTIVFSSTTLVGKVQIRVFLPGMKAPITFSEVPWKHYTRLPNHRPPLRRDKPVRVSLPALTQRYIFPSPDRSFIFIPRQMRPNHQGFQQRGSYQRSAGGHGYSSRRTSMYGGSVYAPSMAASRRSSLAGGISRADAFSPHSFASASFGGGMPSQNMPVVRLPHGVPQYSGANTPSGPLSGQHTPMGLPQMHTYPLPQQPTFQGTPTSTVHQPRPQKAISVTGIESPALLQQASQEAQPFQNQLPAHMVEQPAYGSQPPYYSPRQQYQYPQQPQGSTPLSGIPEQAVHAQSFQAPGMPYAQQPYYAPYPPQQNYYYSPPGPNGFPSMPMYIPPQSYGMMPPPAPMAPQQQPPSEPPSFQPSESQQQTAPQEHSSQPQSGMVAHESNGMVFYIPASEAQEREQSQNYQPAEGFVPSYAIPGLPPTPAPEASAAYFYPPMPPQQIPGMMPMNPGAYYSGQEAQQ